MDELVLVVTESHKGRRIDRLLSEAFPQLSRSRFQKLLRDGQVTARGKRVRSAYRVLEGDEIRVRVPAPPVVDLEPENIPLDIVYEDDDLLVVDKKAGVVVHPAAGNETGTLVHALLYHRPELRGGPDASRPGIVHRLDKDTTGLLMIAKNEFSHAALAEALQRRDVHRSYVALVWGHFAEANGRLEGAVGRHPADRKKMAVVTRGGKEARTRYQEKERFDFSSLLEVQIETGRTHQIRVHMAHFGHPVFGDATYGGRNSGLTGLGAGSRVIAREALKSLNRQALHAFRLEFEHPRTQRTMALESPIPEDMVKTLDLLRRPVSGAN